MYRPDGFENPYSPYPFDGIDSILDMNTGELTDGMLIRKQEVAFELGADAMLEALLKESKNNLQWMFVDTLLKANGIKLGTVVFISDKE